LPAAAAPDASRPGTAAAQTAPPPAGAELRLADAQRRIGRLERQLELEVKRRKDVEAEMARLLQETSAGPYQQADNVVEKHLREELGRARKEISQLQSTLLTERRQRDELERRFAALQAQVQAAAGAAPRGGVSDEEVEALKERQRRVLASIQQDLAASKNREAELRQALEQSQGADGVSVAEEVGSLRSQNSALQMRLDEEHQRNRELSAKLQLATRVTDLIYKMQSSGSESVAAIPLPAAP
jgi:chromosome segregation ATPase